MGWRDGRPLRCHWFNADGTKRMQRTGQWGCIYHTCHFVHPGDPKWAEAKQLPHPNPEGERQAVKERERAYSEKDLERGGERDLERDRDERERDHDRDRDRPRSPPRAGPSTLTASSMLSSSSSYATSRDPRTRSLSNSTSALPTSSSRALSPRPPPRSDSPTKPGGSPSLSWRDSMHKVQPMSATTSANLSRTDTLPARTSSSSAFDSKSGHGDRSSYSDRDRERDRDRDRYRDRSPTMSSRLPAPPPFSRPRQGSGAGSTAPPAPAHPPEPRPPPPSAMPPPPPKLSVHIASLAPAGFSPAVTPTQSVSNGEPSASKPSPTRQDKIQVWADRIKILAEAVQVRMQHVAAERDVLSLRAVSNSQRYGNLSDSAREKMEKKIKEAEERVAQKRAELNTCVYKLVDSDFWDAPLSWQALGADPRLDLKGKGKETEPSWLARETSADERFRELRTVVWQVRDGVSELYKMMGEIRGAPSSATLPTASTDEQKTGDATRPNKRRRTSDAGVEDTSSTTRSSTLAIFDTPAASSERSSDSALAAPLVPPAEVEAIMDSLNDLDGRVADLENTMVQFDSDILSELERRMEERFNEITVSGTKTPPDEVMDVDGVQAGESAQTESEAAPPRPRTIFQRLEDVEGEVQKAGNDIAYIAHEIASIIHQSQSQESEVEKLTKENAELKERIFVMEKQLQEHTEALQAFKNETEAMNAALQAYMSRPTSPPPAPPPAPPPIPDPQSIADSVMPIVLESIRNDVRAPLEELQREVQQTIKQKNAEVAQNLMSKLQLTLQTVQVIYNWMNSTVSGQRPPEPASAPTPTPATPVAAIPAPAPVQAHAVAPVPVPTPAPPAMPYAMPAMVPPVVPHIITQNVRSVASPTVSPNTTHVANQGSSSTVMPTAPPTIPARAYPPA